jgi:micrococcal nuclease
MRLQKNFIPLAILLLTSIMFYYVTDRTSHSTTVTSSAESVESTSPVAARNAPHIASSTLPAEPLPEEPTTTVSLVIRVVDGDTIDVQTDGNTTRVRFIGVDTPETVKPHTPVQCYGPEASAETKTMLTGKFVRLETDPSQDTYDVYGRLLAYVFLPNGALYNEYLIENGFGREYTFKGRTYHYQAAFKAAQNTAKSEKRGLWATGACAH